MKYNDRKLYSILLGVSLLLLGLAPEAVLAADDPSIRSITPRLRRPAGERFLSVGVKPTYTPSKNKDVLDKNNYRIFRITPDKTKDRYLEIDRVTIDTDEEFARDEEELRSSVRIYLADPLDILEGDKLIVTYVGKTLAGEEVKATPTMTVEEPLKKPSQGDPKPKNSPSRKFTFKGAKGRDDANLYFRGEVETASGKDLSGSVDLKFDLPFQVGLDHRLAPFIDLKASSSPDADPDTLKIGIGIRSILAQSGTEYSPDFFVSGIIWKNDGMLEGDRDYDNLNLVYSTEFRFPLKEIPLSKKAEDAAFINLTPFAGAELGKNLQSPVLEAEHRAIARLSVGTNLYARIYKGNESFARVTMDGLYQRRWALKDEVHFEDVDGVGPDGKPTKVTVPVFFGKKATQWAEVNLNINLSEAFGFFAGYEYGQLPPSYKLVDHALKFGVVLKAKLK
ncbi:MAG TPA: hypothetical protein VLR90_08475 [Blastocatellia bacterium]|nr:hypothetical protein [Blastocatellia bacterium]